MFLDLETFQGLKILELHKYDEFITDNGMILNLIISKKYK